MARAIFVGGLGDSPLSLQPWKHAFLKCGFETQFVDVQVSHNLTFGDRVAALKAAICDAKEPVYLVGQSAGGLAALMAASDLRVERRVRGVIAVSPAMPRGINPIGWPLMSRMWRYQLDMLRGRLIMPRGRDYRDIALNGLSDEDANKFTGARRPISGREANELATPWLQPKLGPIDVPVVYVHGGTDRWVAPRAHRRFVRLLEKNVAKFKSAYLPEGGHLPAHHHLRGKEVVDTALRFFNLPA